MKSTADSIGICSGKLDIAKRCAHSPLKIAGGEATTKLRHSLAAPLLKNAFQKFSPWASTCHQQHRLSRHVHGDRRNPHCPTRARLRVHMLLERAAGCCPATSSQQEKNGRETDLIMMQQMLGQRTVSKRPSRIRTRRTTSLVASLPSLLSMNSTSFGD